MNIRHKVIQDFHYVTEDKNIIILKAGTILENRQYKTKTEIIEIDRDIIDNNVSFFKPIDWKEELSLFIKSNKLPQPATLKKKFMPFIEEMFIIPNSKNNSNPNYKDIEVDLEKKSNLIDKKESELSKKEESLLTKEIELNSKENSLQLKSNKLDTEIKSYLNKKLELDNLEKRLKKLESELNKKSPTQNTGDLISKSKLISIINNKKSQGHDVSLMVDIIRML